MIHYSKATEEEQTLQRSLRAETYIGSPCKRVGHRVRYKSNKVCVLCAKVSNREFRNENRKHNRDWWARNPERVKRSEKEWRENNADYHKKWLENNPDYHKNWRAENPGFREQWATKHPNHLREWHKRNPEKAKEYTHRRRALIAAVPSSPYNFPAICELYDNRCLACGEQLPLTIDHVIPISLGGPDTPDNIQPLCKSCNSSKGARYIDYRGNIRITLETAGEP